MYDSRDFDSSFEKPLNWYRKEFEILDQKIQLDSADHSIKSYWSSRLKKYFLPATAATFGIFLIYATVRGVISLYSHGRFAVGEFGEFGVVLSLGLFIGSLIQFIINRNSKNCETATVVIIDNHDEPIKFGPGEMYAGSRYRYSYLCNRHRNK